MRHRVVDEAMQVINLSRLRERSYLHALLPWRALAKRRHLFREALHELVRDSALHKKYLERRATLAIKGERARHTFVHRPIHIRVIQHDAWIFRSKPEHRM